MMSYLVDMHTTPSDVIAQQVRRRRTDMGLNREAIAARCADLGAPKLTVAALTNIETGRPDAGGHRRREVSAEELLVLGRALQAPPILLLFPLESGATIDISPGVTVPTWAALKWFSGEAPFPHWEDRDETGALTAEIGNAVDLEAWEQGASPIRLYRAHERHVEEWQISVRRAAHYRKQAERPELAEEARASRLRDAEAEDRTAHALRRLIWDNRREVRRLGIATPDLPEQLRDLDDETSPAYREFETERREKQERDQLRLIRDS